MNSIKKQLAPENISLSAWVGVSPHANAVFSYEEPWVVYTHLGLDYSYSSWLVSSFLSNLSPPDQFPFKLPKWFLNSGLTVSMDFGVFHACQLSRTPSELLVCHPPCFCRLPLLSKEAHLSLPCTAPCVCRLFSPPEACFPLPAPSRLAQVCHLDRTAPPHLLMDFPLTTSLRPCAWPHGSY